MNAQPTEIERDTVERWLPENLLGIVTDVEDWHVVATDIPGDVGRSRATKVRKIRSLDLGSMQLLSLAQSRLQVTVQTIVGLSVYVSADDYRASAEVRDWVGEVEEDFLGCHMDFDAPISLTLELKLLKEPPMVLSCALREVQGGYGSIVMK